MDEGSGYLIERSADDTIRVQTERGVRLQSRVAPSGLNSHRVPGCPRNVIDACGVCHTPETLVSGVLRQRHSELNQGVINGSSGGVCVPRPIALESRRVNNGRLARQGTGAPTYEGLMGGYKERIKKKNQDHQWRELGPSERCRFLEDLRQARMAAQLHSEAFDQVLFAFERLGSFRLGEVATLNDYEPSLLDLVNQSAFAFVSDGTQFAWHSESSVLLYLIRNARNDALHQGSRARHLTQHAIEFSLILEDALMNGTMPMVCLRDVMVRSPLTADEWQPVSLVRNAMLTNSFSHLPIKFGNDWQLVSECNLAAFLRQGRPSVDQRRIRLAMTIQEALKTQPELKLFSTTELYIDSLIDEIHGIERPVLVFDRSNQTNLVGIVTAFDIL
jgi:CBS domain-containing protein